MKRFSLGLVLLLLVGCGNNLNEFEYAYTAEQLAVTAMIDDCNSTFGNSYCKILKNGDIVYFDDILENTALIETHEKLRDISTGVYYDAFMKTELEPSPFMVERMKELTDNITNFIKRHGSNEKFIFVVRDENGDLVYRATNGKVDYNYFDSPYAKKVYEQYIAEKGESNN